MSTQLKPLRAWVALTDSGEHYAIAFSKSACEHRMTGLQTADFSTYETFIAAHERALSTLLNSNWRIVEVQVREVEK